MTEKIDPKKELEKIKPPKPKEITYISYAPPKNGTDHVEVLKYDNYDDRLELYLEVISYPDTYLFRPPSYSAKWTVQKDNNSGSIYHLILEAAKKNGNKINGLNLVVTSNYIRKKSLKDSIKKPGKRQKLSKPYYPYP